jgi:hypothetical protein
MSPLCYMQVIAQYMGSASTLDLLCGLVDLRMRFERMGPPAGGGHHGQVGVASCLIAFLVACLLLSWQPALLAACPACMQVVYVDSVPLHHRVISLSMKGRVGVGQTSA